MSISKHTAKALVDDAQVTLTLWKKQERRRSKISCKLLLMPRNRASKLMLRIYASKAVPMPAG